MSMLLRRYHKKPEPQQEAVENVTSSQLAEHMKSPAFAKAFNEELAAEHTKQSARLAEVVSQETQVEDAKLSGALESEIE